MNPRGQVPTFIDNGVVVCESGAAVQVRTADDMVACINAGELLVSLAKFLRSCLGPLCSNPQLCSFASPDCLSCEQTAISYAHQRFPSHGVCTEALLRSHRHCMSGMLTCSLLALTVILLRQYLDAVYSDPPLMPTDRKALGLVS